MNPTTERPVDVASIGDPMERMTFSAAGALKAAEILAAQSSSSAAIRVYVKSGGCSGYSYGMAVDDTPRADDRIFVHRGARLMVDPRSWPLLRGSEIDYVENMMGGGFQVTNPNATSACGCGSSFRTDGRAAPEGESVGCGS